ncbi:MAG: hypothetical protein ABIH38_00600 [Patescibacteria group bacterium]
MSREKESSVKAEKGAFMRSKDFWLAYLLVVIVLTAVFPLMAVVDKPLIPYYQVYLVLSLSSISIWTILCYVLRKRVNEVLVVIVAGTMVMYLPVISVLLITPIPGVDNDQKCFARIDSLGNILKIYPGPKWYFGHERGKVMLVDRGRGNFSVKVGPDESLIYEVSYLPLPDLKPGQPVPQGTLKRQEFARSFSNEIIAEMVEMARDSCNIPYCEVARRSIERVVKQKKPSFQEISFAKM